MTFCFYQSPGSIVTLLSLSLFFCFSFELRVISSKINAIFSHRNLRVVINFAISYLQHNDIYSYSNNIEKYMELYAR